MIRLIGQAGRDFFAGSSSYQLINMLVAWFIIFLFAYFATWGTGNNGYPAGCVHIGFLGEECSTCGLSRSLSEMLRGNFGAASVYNKNGPLLFVFFASQLVLRIIAGLLIFRFEGGKICKSWDIRGFSSVGRMITKVTGTGGRAGVSERIGKLARIDAGISVLLFLVCFRYLLAFW